MFGMVVNNLLFWFKGLEEGDLKEVLYVSLDFYISIIFNKSYFFTLYCRKLCKETLHLQTQAIDLERIPSTDFDYDNSLPNSCDSPQTTFTGMYLWYIFSL